MRPLVFVMCFVFLASCSKPPETIPTSQVQLHQDSRITVQLSPAAAPVEQLLTWQLKLAQGWQVKQAMVVGVSMSMGTIPLLFKKLSSTPDLYTAEMVLGACSQPQMKWQLQSTLQRDSEPEQQLLVPFYSSWPR